MENSNSNQRFKNYEGSENSNRNNMNSRSRDRESLPHSNKDSYYFKQGGSHSTFYDRDKQRDRFERPSNSYSRDHERESNHRYEKPREI